jgi:hypothetical protein
MTLKDIIKRIVTYKLNGNPATFMVYYIKASQ